MLTVEMKKLFAICLLHPFLLFAEEPVSIA
ncbi:uncharacterized protein METZ01_LOCUS515964, partial [marine metagenome]